MTKVQNPIKQWSYSLTIKKKSSQSVVSLLFGFLRVHLYPPYQVKSRMSPIRSIQSIPFFNEQCYQYQTLSSNQKIGHESQGIWTCCYHHDHYNHTHQSAISIISFIASHTYLSSQSLHNLQLNCGLQIPSAVFPEKQNALENAFKTICWWIQNFECSSMPNSSLHIPLTWSLKWQSLNDFEILSLLRRFLLFWESEL